MQKACQVLQRWMLSGVKCQNTFAIDTELVHTVLFKSFTKLYFVVYLQTRADSVFHVLKLHIQPYELALTCISAFILKIQSSEYFVAV